MRISTKMSNIYWNINVILEKTILVNYSLILPSEFFKHIFSSYDKLYRLSLEKISKRPGKDILITYLKVMSQVSSAYFHQRMVFERREKKEVL